MRNYFPLDSFTIITIFGKDRLKWLNNLVTNDLKRTSENQAVECFVTDVKGRTLAHGIVFSDRESLAFVSWGKDQAAKLIAHWDRYIIREDVTLVDDSSNWRWAFVRRAWLTTELKSDRIEQLANMEVAAIGNSESPIAIACPAIGNDWLLVRFRNDDSIHSLLSDFSLDNQLEDAIALEANRIRQRWPLVGIDFDEKNLPQELDRTDTAISFNKGCYLGQETVARLDALGQVQKKLVLLSIDVSDLGNPNGLEVGAIVKKDEQEAGTITSMTVTEAGSGLVVALAYIRRAHFATGTELTCNGFRAVVSS